MKKAARWLVLVSVSLAATVGVYLLVKDDPPKALARYATSPAKLFAAVAAMVAIVILVPGNIVMTFVGQRRELAHKRATFLRAKAQILGRQRRPGGGTRRRYELQLLIEHPVTGERYERNFTVSILFEGDTVGLERISVGNTIEVRVDPKDRMRMFVDTDFADRTAR